MSIDSRDPGIGSEDAEHDDVQWSRAWEWPSWMRAPRWQGWRPEPRTLGLVLVLMYAPLLASWLWSLRQLVEALIPPANDIFFAGVPPWDRAYAGSLLGQALGEAVAMIGAALLLARFRRAGALVALAGLLIDAMSRGLELLAFFHAGGGVPTGTTAGTDAALVSRLLLIAATVLVLRRPPAVESPAGRAGSAAEPEPAPLAAG